jgi:hypothetical protein
MAQFDIILTQNVHLNGIEYAEKLVNIAKGALLSAAADGTPTILSAPAANKMLIGDPNEPTGLKWVDQPTHHNQNTDTGTNSQSFDINSGANGVKLKVEPGNDRLELKSLDDQQYKNFKARDAEFEHVSVPNAPTASNHLTNKSYVDNLLSANQAMQFKGSVGAAGTLTVSAFNSLNVYNAGWVYVVLDAATVKGNTCEPGDVIMCMVTRNGSGAVNGDWVVKQGNLDGVIIGPSSSSDGYPAVFDGISGKLLKQAPNPLGSAAYAEAADFATAAQGLLADGAIPKSILTANTIIFATTPSTPVALTVAASTFVGRKASGGIAAMTAAEARAILNVADDATANQKNTGAEINDGSDDNKFSTAKSISDSRIMMGPVASVLDCIPIFGDTGGKNLKDSGKRLTDYKEQWVNAPGSKTSTGTIGQFAYDTNFFYICVAANTWARTPIARTW